MPQVTGIHVYPIKSCRGVRLPFADVTERGLAHDRRYMLIDAKGRFLTQREQPRLARVDVELGADGFVVAAPGRPPLELPFEMPVRRECRVRIWRDTVDAALAGDAVNAWFSEYLGRPCGLVYMAAEHHRALSREEARFDDEVSFADGAPLLLISEASLEDLNSRLPRPVGMHRFRPNVVVTAERAFDEDGWRRIGIGEAELEVAWPCPRCIMTTIDRETGVKAEDGEPLKTLKRYRLAGRGAMFGQNLIPRRLGEIRVADEVRLIERA
jgi:uncharacterized protein YcbX